MPLDANALGAALRRMMGLVHLTGDVIPFRRQSIEPGMGLSEGAGRMGGNTGGGGRGGEVVQMPTQAQPLNLDIGNQLMSPKQREIWNQHYPGGQRGPGEMTPEARQTMEFLQSDAGRYWLALQMQQGFAGPGWTKE